MPPNATKTCEQLPSATPKAELVAVAATDIGHNEQVLLLKTDHWWQDPELVAQWAVPFGAALNSVQLNRYGGGGDPNNRANREDWQSFEDTLLATTWLDQAENV